MTREPSFSLAVAGPLAGLFLFVSVLVASDPLRAEPSALAAHPTYENDARTSRLPLDGSDELAALDAVQIALTEAADGATYVWQRHHGRLNGAVRMTSTFRGSDGRLCRHLVMTLSSGGYSRKTEGIACRDRDLVWSLEG